MLAIGLEHWAGRKSARAQGSKIITLRRGNHKSKGRVRAGPLPACVITVPLNMESLLTTFHFLETACKPHLVATVRMPGYTHTHTLHTFDRVKLAVQRERLFREQWEEEQGQRKQAPGQIPHGAFVVHPSACSTRFQRFAVPTTRGHGTARSKGGGRCMAALSRRRRSAWSEITAEMGACSVASKRSGKVDKEQDAHVHVAVLHHRLLAAAAPCLLTVLLPSSLSQYPPTPLGFAKHGPTLRCRCD